MLTIVQGNRAILYASHAIISHWGLNHLRISVIGLWWLIGHNQVVVQLLDSTNRTPIRYPSHYPYHIMLPQYCKKREPVFTIDSYCGSPDKINLIPTKFCIIVTWRKNVCQCTTTVIVATVQGQLSGCNGKQLNCSPFPQAGEWKWKIAWYRDE